MLLARAMKLSGLLATAMDAGFSCAFLEDLVLATNIAAL